MHSSGSENSSSDLNSGSQQRTEDHPAEPDSGSIDALAEKLERLERARAGRKGRSAPARDDEGRRQSYRDASRGMKMATEFACAVMIGAFLGYLIDRLLGTLPLFMLILFVLGAVSGFLNAYRAAIGKDDDRFAGYELFGLKSSGDRSGTPEQIGSKEQSVASPGVGDEGNIKNSQAGARTATEPLEQKEGR